MKKHIVFGIIAALLMSSVAYAEIPKYITTQGRLTDSDGDPLSGSYTFLFKIYDDQVTGNKLWEETQTLEVDTGVFNAVLGSANPLNLDFDKPYWLEIEVNGETMSPRVRITSSGFTYSARRLLPTTFPIQFDDGVVSIRIYRDTDVGDWSLLRSDSGNGIAIIGAPDTVGMSVSRNDTSVRFPQVANCDPLKTDSEGKLGCGTPLSSFDCSGCDNEFVNVIGDMMTGKLIIDLTSKSGELGRDAIDILASDDNDYGVIRVNKPYLLLWNIPSDARASLKALDVEASSDVIAGDDVIATDDVVAGDDVDIAGSVFVTGDVDFDGEIKPDGASCSNGQILKKTNSNDWDCVADETGITSCSNCDSSFVNEGQSNSITSGMITDGTITSSDVGFSYVSSCDQCDSHNDNRYVNVGGDTMTGPLTIESDLSVTNEITEKGEAVLSNWSYHSTYASWPKTLSIDCPTGKKALGGGCKITAWAGNEGRLIATRPLSWGAGWYCEVTEAASLGAYVMCAEVS